MFENNKVRNEELSIEGHLLGRWRLWGNFLSAAGDLFLLYNFVKKCTNNSQNEYKYTAIFGQLVICTLTV